MNRINPTVAMVIAAILAILLAVYVFAGGNGRSDNRDRLSEEDLAAASETPSDSPCASRQTLDLLKSELFRRAAEARGSDHAAFDNASSASLLRADSPRVARQGGEPGALHCSGTITIELPDGLSVAGGSRSLQARLGYAIEPSSADGSGIVTVSNADTLIATLSTLARAEDEAIVEDVPVDAPVGREDTSTDDRDARVAPPAKTPPTPPARPAPREPEARPKAVASPPRVTAAPPRAVASPSFNCRYARTRGEVAVCNNPGLARLDRQMAGEFNAAMSAASPAQRDLLQRTRGSFLRYRDSCGSEACMAGAYRDRMREIADILADRWSPQ